MSSDHDNPESICRRCGTPLAGDDAAVCPRCLAENLAAAGTEAPAEASRRLTPRRLGQYELLKEIARGGMGIVYRARQIVLERIVAIKVLRLAAAGSEEHRRFRAEAAQWRNSNPKSISNDCQSGRYRPALLIPPDEKALLIGDGQGVVTRWDIDSNAAPRSQLLHDREIYHMLVSPDQDWLPTVAADVNF